MNFVYRAFVVLAAASVSLTASTQTSRLRLVSTAWTPFTNEAGQPRFALDLVEAAFARVGVNSTTTIVQPAQFTTMLLSGPYDGSGAAWRDAEREKVLVYSRFSDPRTGVVEYRLTQISRAEPASELFAVPTDYTILDSGAGVMRGRVGNGGVRGHM